MYIVKYVKDNGNVDFVHDFISSSLDCLGQHSFQDNFANTSRDCFYDYSDKIQVGIAFTANQPI